MQGSGDLYSPARFMSPLKLMQGSGDLYSPARFTCPSKLVRGVYAL